MPAQEDVRRLWGNDPWVMLSELAYGELSTTINVDFKDTVGIVSTRKYLTLKASWHHHFREMFLCLSLNRTFLAP